MNCSVYSHTHTLTHVHICVTHTEFFALSKQKRNAATSTCDRADTECSQSGMRPMCCVKTDNSNHILLIHSNHSSFILAAHGALTMTDHGLCTICDWIDLNVNEILNLGQIRKRYAHFYFCIFVFC